MSIVKDLEPEELIPKLGRKMTSLSSIPSNLYRVMIKSAFENP